MRLNKSRWKEALRAHRAILIVMALLFLTRLAGLCYLGLRYSLSSDDTSYRLAGLVFADTGTITMHGYITAQIMPGMPVLIGLISLLTGEGSLFLLTLRLLWIVFGTLTAWFLYRSVCLFAPKWCGVAAALPLFAVNYIWMDNLILTETPFILFTTALVYFTLKLGCTGGARTADFVGFAVSFFLALMFRAIILVWLPFAAAYLLLSRYSLRRLLKQALILLCVFLCFDIPWTIRNYRQFDAFIPLTYGSGNPLLLGTYQGSNYPEDEDLDYTANVDEVLRAKYARYFNEDGTVKKPHQEKYVSLLRDEIMAKYRIREWFSTAPISYLHSLIFTKPSLMTKNVFYWTTLYEIPYSYLQNLHIVCYRLTIFSFALAFFLKRARKPMLLLACLYLSNLALCVVSFAFDRYAQVIVPLWYIICGIGLSLFAELGLRLAEKTRAFLKRENRLP